MGVFFRDTEGNDHNEEQMNEAMSSQQVPEYSDHSDVEDNTVLEEYDLDNYDEDGEGRDVPFSKLSTHLYLHLYLNLLHLYFPIFHLYISLLILSP
jgi:uncharacterized protein YxeA